MFAWLRRTLSDDAGNPSVIRHLAVFVVLVILAVWACSVLREGRWIGIDTGTGSLVGAIFTVLGARKYLENNGPGQGGAQ
jgi:hypothetical protein